MRRLLGLAALLAAVWLRRRQHPPRIPTAAELMAMPQPDFEAWVRRIGLRTLSDPADAIQVDPSLHERAGLL